MDKNREVLKKIVGRALSGEGAHSGTGKVFEGLDWKLAGTRPANVSHSVFEVLMHIAYWQDWGLKWFAGKKPAVPRHAAGSWPKIQGPGNAEEWRRAVRNFRRGLEGLERRARKTDLLETIGGKTRLEMLHALASHASYHTGQVVALRQMLGSWPPPSGGLTW